MKCSRAHKLMSPYIDGELSHAEREVFGAHLKQCGQCRMEFETLGKVHALFGQAGKYPAPYGFATRVMATTGSDGKTREPWFPLLIRLAEAAVFVLVITAGVLSGNFLSSRLLPGGAPSVASLMSLDVFDPAPADSPGGVYLAMTEGSNEK